MPIHPIVELQTVEVVLGEPVSCLVDVGPVGAEVGQETVARGLGPAFQDVEGGRGGRHDLARLVQNLQRQAVAAWSFFGGRPG